MLQLLFTCLAQTIIDHTVHIAGAALIQLLFSNFAIAVVTSLLRTMISSAYFTAFFSPPRMNLDATLPRHFSRSQSKPWIVLITRLPKSFGIQQKKAGPSAWICTTSYLPNALQSAAKKEELTAASPPDVKIGTKKFSKKAKK